jgi:hypothetical protein
VDDAVGLLGVGEEVQDRDQEQRDGLGQVEGVGQGFVGQDLSGIATLWKRT